MSSPERPVSGEDDVTAGPEGAAGDALSAAPLLVRIDGGAWSAPGTVAWADEATLRDQLAANPTLLPGITATATVAVTELRVPDTGPADVVAVTPTGEIVVCECKLRRNPEIRRWVIGQVLSYAAGLAAMTLEEFRVEWQRRASASLEEQALGAEHDAEAVSEFLSAVAANLAAGRFRIVIAVDEITDELRRTIRFLATHTTSDVSIVALEIAYAKVASVEVLVPRVWGAELAPKPPVSVFTPAEVVAAAEARAAGFGAVVQQLFDRLGERIDHLYFGTATVPSAVVCVTSPVKCEPFKIIVGQKIPGIRLCLHWMGRLGDDARARIVQAASQHPAVASILGPATAAGLDKRPLLPYEGVLDQPDALKAVVDAVIVEIDRGLAPTS